MSDPVISGSKKVRYVNQAFSDPYAKFINHLVLLPEGVSKSKYLTNVF